MAFFPLPPSFFPPLSLSYAFLSFPVCAAIGFDCSTWVSCLKTFRRSLFSFSFFSLYFFRFSFFFHFLPLPLPDISLRSSWPLPFRPLSLFLALAPLSLNFTPSSPSFHPPFPPWFLLRSSFYPHRGSSSFFSPPLPDPSLLVFSPCIPPHNPPKSGILPLGLSFLVLLLPNRPVATHGHGWKCRFGWQL